MGTNWFMPALVNRRFGESGMRLEEGTMVCCFDLKKSRNDWRISELVIIESAKLREDAGNVKRKKTELVHFFASQKTTEIRLQNHCKKSAKTLNLTEKTLQIIAISLQFH